MEADRFLYALLLSVLSTVPRRDRVPSSREAAAVWKKTLEAQSAQSGDGGAGGDARDDDGGSGVVATAVASLVENAAVMVAALDAAAVAVALWVDRKGRERCYE